MKQYALFLLKKRKLKVELLENKAVIMGNVVALFSSVSNSNLFDEQLL